VSDDRPDSENLLDLLYPEGQDPAHLERLRRAVAADPQATERLRGYQEVRRMVAELPVPEPERAVHYEILRQARAAAAASSADSSRRGWRAWLSGGHFGPALAGALGLVLAVGGTMMLTREDAAEAPSPVETAAAPAHVSPHGAVSADRATGAGDAPAVAAAPSPAKEAPPVAQTWANAPAAAAPALELAEGASDKAVARRGPGSNTGDGLGVLGGKGGGGYGRGAGATATSADPRAESKAEASADPFPSGGDAPAGAGAARGFAPPPKSAESETTRGPADEAPMRDAYEADDGIIGGVAPKAPAPEEERRRESAKPMARRPAEDQEKASADVDDLLGAEPAAQPVQAAAAPAAPPPPPAAAAPAPTRPEPAKKAKSAERASASARADENAEVAERRPEAGAGDPLALARVARKVQQWRVAVRHYQDYLDRIPEAQRMPAVLFETADAYERAGETARALELYRLVARSGGPQAGAAEKRIAALEAARRPQAAPPKASPQAAPPAQDEVQAEPATPAERK
jgi:hypothetical protein